MPGIDVFNSDAFSMFSLTAAINKAPYVPKFLRELGIFQQKPIRTTVAAVEDRQGTLALVPTSARGTIGDARRRPSRTIRNFNVPHIPYFENIRADEVQNIRAFGSETELEAVGTVVNEQMIAMRRDIEATLEYHRIGAIQGNVLDADASTVIYNYFTEFGVSELAVDFNFTTAGLSVKEDLANAVVRNMSTILGMTPFTKILAICGDNYFDALTDHASVKEGYERWQSSQFFRDTQLGPEYRADMNGFDYGGITWVNYRGKVGDVDFFPTAQARFIPLGVPDLFLEVVAPGDMIETVNTMGQPFYAKQEIEKFGKGVLLHVQTNTLMIPTRPRALIKSTGTFA